MPFDVIPAIDLAGGRVVRLVQGRFDAVTDFGGEPLDVGAPLLGATAPGRCT